MDTFLLSLGIGLSLGIVVCIVLWSAAILKGTVDIFRTIFDLLNQGYRKAQYEENKRKWKD